MLETPHVVVGAAIASKVANPILSLPLAFGSHFLMDQIPHWNPHSYTETQTNGKISRNTTILAIADVITALSAGLWLASRAMPNWTHAIVIIAASFLAVLPDVVKAPYFLLGKRDGLLKRYVDFERSLQVETNFIAGMGMQLFVILVALMWIK